MGSEAFREYINRVYTELMMMNVGERFSIDKNVRPENIELFIKTGCMFILDGFYDYEFSNDYKYIIRHEKTKMDKRTTAIPQGKPGEKNA
jgi:hypothetical protein